MSKFKVGDRVSHDYKSGRFGDATVVFIREDDSGWIWLDFDKPGASTDRHDCDGRAKPECGYKANACCLILAKKKYNWKKI